MSNSANDMADLAQLRSFSEEYGIATVTFDGDNSFYVDRPMCCYSTLVKEIVDVTRKMFPLSDKREDTFISGTSMGGFGAFYNGIRYSDIFGKIALSCPGFDIYEIKNPLTGEAMIPAAYLDTLFGSEENYHNTDFDYRVALKNAIAQGVDIPKLFYSCGRQDVLVGEGVKKFGAFLKENSIPAEYFECDGGHDMVFARQVFPEIFKFLTEKE